MKVGVKTGLAFAVTAMAAWVVPRADVAVDFKIDLGKDNHPISPLIYGSNSDELTAEDGVTFRRSGGNRLTGYNWENNASHAGTDWYNNSDAFMGGGNAPGKSMTDFHDQVTAGGAASLITLPAAGYVAKDKKGVVAENEAAPSARWAKVVFKKGKPFAATPDTTDGEVYTDEFIDFLVKKYGDAGTDKGVKYYCVDNEPGLWPSTHPRIHPAKPTAVELVQKTRDLSIAVKAVDPKALIFGGVFYGYNDYASLQDAPDWKATLNASGKYAWYIDYFLEEMKKASDASGKRLMDVLDLHWYSEASGDNRINVDTATTPKDRAARLQAPRSLWDPDYAEDSWISKWATPKQPVTNWNDPTPGPINLIPRVLESIRKYNPGTRIAITEYNYGEANHVTGGLANADFLGVAGRTDVFAASFWQLGLKPTYVASAFRLFRNYDGKKGRFGSTSVSATASDKANASIFASFESGGDEVHIIAINKNATESVKGGFSVTSPVALTSGKVYGFDGSGTALSEKAAVATITGNAFSYTLPPWSASHFVIKVSGTLTAGIRIPSTGRAEVTGQLHQGPAYLPDGRLLRNGHSAEGRIPSVPLFAR
jgi:mannan endo-1,4-beta-mannosidase